MVSYSCLFLIFYKDWKSLIYLLDVQKAFHNHYLILECILWPELNLPRGHVMLLTLFTGIVIIDFHFHLPQVICTLIMLAYYNSVWNPTILGINRSVCEIHVSKTFHFYHRMNQGLHYHPLVSRNPYLDWIRWINFGILEFIKKSLQGLQYF